MIVRDGVKNRDGVLLFSSGVVKDHEDYNAIGLDVLYAAEENHFWFISRKKRILNTFKRYVKLSESVLEVGAGTGNVSRALQKGGYNVSVGEMHLNGLRYAKSYGIKNCYQFDLFDPPFLEHFGAIGMFDVLEHLEDDVFAMQCLYAMLKPNGHVVLTVPAHQWLWSRDDVIAAHKRRYSLKQLKAVMKKAGFQVIHARYFLVSILPLLLLRRIIKASGRQSITDKDSCQEITIHPVINRILKRVTMLENKFASWVPNFAGGSIILVAKKI